MHLRCILLMTVLAGFGDPAAGYSNGKVSGACKDMKPHHGSPSSTDPPPYKISTDKSIFGPGDRITVTLQAMGYKSFKGFLIEARKADDPDSPALGSFSLVDPAVSQLLRCGDTEASGVSHVSGSKKLQVQAVWEPPKKPPNRVQFFVTVVQKYKVLWMKIPGPVVTLEGSSAIPTTPSSTTEATSPAALSAAFDAEGCGRSKSCLRDPAGCRPGSDRRCFFLSFAPEAAGGSVQFELSGPTEGYVAFALSLDKWMGNDDVYLCMRDEDRVAISAAYVYGRTRPEQSQEASLLDKAWRMSDGVVQCRFRRNILLLEQESRFNLNHSYFLFLAHGSAQHGFIYKHDRQPLISTSRIVVAGPPQDLSGSRSPLLIKFHGGLMLTVWMWLVSTGVLFARHFRSSWPDTLLLGHKPWFQVHRALMVVAVALTGVAFILPFLYRGGWSKRAGYHPYIGCTVMALSVIQPIMAALRPAAASSRRNLFNWAHRGTGAALQILAVVCVFLGFQQHALLLPGPWCPGLLSAWLLWVLLTDLALLVLPHVLRTRGKDCNVDKETTPFVQPERCRQAEGSKFKQIAMVVFQIGNVGFLGALLNTITNV